ncbi:MAG: YfhO family protein, partial [Ruminiclostridium sp.]|nr:YfhO family protein [Ruminiclostridium sp.]
KSRGLSKTTAATFSLMYSLCAYMVVETMNPMWLDGVLILPIVCFGIEALIKENRFKLLIASLCYAFITNFYIGFMIAIFTVIYFLYYFFANTEYDRAGKVLSSLFKKGLFTGLCGITSALISAFMIFPVYSSLQNGKFTFTTPDFSLVNNFELLEIATKLFPNSYDTVRMEGLPFIFCGSVALILAAAYFCSRKFKFSQKVAAGALLFVMIASMYIRPVDMLWHGGQMPNWLPYRYSFMISFILVMLAAQSFEQLKSLKKRTLGIITLGYIGLIVYTESTDTFSATLGSEGRELFDGITVALPAIVFMAIAGITLYLLIKKLRQKKALSVVASIVFCAVIVAELCFNTTNTLQKMHKDIVFSTRNSYLDVVLPLREKVEQIKDSDGGFYRIEKNFFRSVNDPLAANMYGLSHSSSVLNEKAIDMLGYFGFTSNGHYTRFSGNTPITSDIFGVKYILDCKDHNTANIESAEDITVQENLDALPIAFLSDLSISALEMEKDTVFENQNMLISALIGTDGEYFKVFSPTGIPSYQNCTKGNYAGGHVGFTNVKGEASVTYKATVIESGDVYMFIPTDYQRQVSLYVNDEYKGLCFESDNHNIKYLG